MVSWLRREDLYLLLFSFGLMYECHNGAIPLIGNISLRHLLNEETLFMSWRRSAIKVVNDWALRVLRIESYAFLVDYFTYYIEGGNTKSGHTIMIHVETLIATSLSSNNSTHGTKLYCCKNTSNPKWGILIVKKR